MLILSFEKEEVKNSRIQRRVYELLAKAAASGPPHSGAGRRELHFVFFRKPEKFLSSVDKKGHVAGVRFEKTVLEGKVSMSYFLRLLNRCIPRM